MPADANETGKLLAEYTALAPCYDRRWHAYLDASLAMTFEVVGPLPRTRVLDVACGTGLLLEMLANQPGEAELFGVDRVPAMLDVARQRLGKRATLLEGEAENLPFDDAAFDLVTCTSALHYFAHADAALTEMRRVLSPPGNLVITDWSRDNLTMKLLDRILPMTRHAHVHTFTLDELESHLAATGFRTVARSRRKIDRFWGLMTVRANPETREIVSNKFN